MSTTMRKSCFCEVSPLRELQVFQQDTVVSRTLSVETLERPMQPRLAHVCRWGELEGRPSGSDKRAESAT